MSAVIKHDLKELGFEVAEHTSAMLGYWDKDLICRFANQAYMQWFGVKPADMIDKITIQELLGDLYEKNLPYIQGALQGKVQVFGRNITTPSGKIKNSIATYCPHFQDEDVKGFFVHVADVTGLKVREEENDAYKTIFSSDAENLENIEKQIRSSLLTGFPGVNVLAKKNFISVSKAKRDFKEKFGKGMFKYFRELQMELAHRYLLEKRCNKKQMAFMLNFSNPSNFSICYNKYLSAQKVFRFKEDDKKSGMDIYHAFVAQSPFAIAMVNKNFELLAASEQWMQAYNVNPAKYPGRNILKIRPFNAPHWKSLFIKCIDAGTINTDEEKYLNKHGKEFWIKWDVRPWRNISGEIGGLLLYTEDTTALKSREEENRKILKILSKTNEIAKIGAWKKNFKDNSRIWSQVTREIFEVPDTYNPSYKNTLLFFREGSGRELVKEVVRTALRKKEGFDFKAEIITAKGNFKTVRIIGYTEFHNGECETISGIIQDITHEKQRALNTNYAFANSTNTPVNYE